MEHCFVIQRIGHTYTRLQKSPGGIEQGAARIFRAVDQSLPSIYAPRHPGGLRNITHLRNSGGYLVPAPTRIRSQNVLGVHIKNRSITIPMAARVLVVITQAELYRQLGVDLPVVHKKSGLALVVRGDQEVPPLIEAGRAKHNFGQRMARQAVVIVPKLVGSSTRVERHGTAEVAAIFNRKRIVMLISRLEGMPVPHLTVREVGVVNMVGKLVKKPSANRCIVAKLAKLPSLEAGRDMLAEPLAAREENRVKRPLICIH